MKLPGGLRVRTAVSFALLALLLSMVLSVSTYQLARSYLLDQRESFATRQALVNAAVLAGLLPTERDEAADVLASLPPTPGVSSLLRLDDRWVTTGLGLDESALPSSVSHDVAGGDAVHQRIRVDGVPYVVTGVPLPGGGEYFEFAPLVEYERTISTLLKILVSAASMTTIAGAAAGWLVSRRVLRPLRDFAGSARRMSAGQLSTRFTAHRDPDLEPAASAFNEIADSLSRRIEREARFTADVNHELRTPITALATAVAIAQRSSSLEQTKFVLDVMADSVAHLQRLTLELLEISRIDAGIATPNVEAIDVVAIVRRVVTMLGCSPDVVHTDLDPDDAVHEVDPVLFERVIGNLVENAVRYGAGPTAVTVTRASGALTVVVDDCGPGVPIDERRTIFGRFSRGAAAAVPGREKGTGLGLSLVHEYVTLHDGTVRVEDAPSGGARFVVRLP